MSKTLWWLILIVGVGIAAAILYFALKEKPPSFPPVVTPPSSAPSPAGPPQPRFPIKEEAPEKPLPPLEKSDAEAKEALGGLWGEGAIEKFFNLDEFVRRVVATIDNLPRKKVAQRLMPLKPVGGQFEVSGKDEELAISPDNAKRYDRYMKLLEAVDTKRLVALYVHYYPLFQKAYRELGYPEGYFNDRLVEVIDHLLTTPDVEPPVKLVQPKVFYQFAEPELEDLSAGRKILIRMGRDHAYRVKGKLREIRKEITRHGPAKE